MHLAIIPPSYDLSSILICVIPKALVSLAAFELNMITVSSLIFVIPHPFKKIFDELSYTFLPIS
jgi:hypothetical protein